MDLAEVEQAMSVLDGRHPGFARAEREKAQAAERRRTELEQLAVRTRRRNIRTAVIGSALFVVIGTGAWFAREHYETRRHAIALVDPLAKRFETLGFQEVKPSPWKNPEKLEVELTAGTCAIALAATTGGAPIAVELFHDGDTLEAQGSLGFCTCANETAIITAKGAEPGKRAVRLLRTDARDFGSVQGFGRGTAKPASVLDCACAEDQIDGWLSMPAAAETLHAPDVDWAKKDGAAIELASSGLTPAHSTEPGAVLLPLAVSPGGCTVAVSGKADDTLAIRAQGGNKIVPAEKLPVAVCSKTARTFAVWHTGAGAVHLLRGDAARLGGRHQLRRVLDRAGLVGGRVWVDPTELEWDAELTLRAVRAAPTRTSEWGSKVKLSDDARVFLFSIEGGTASEPPATSTGEAACDRGDDKSPTLFCVQTSRQPWREPETKLRSAVAHAPLPVWLKPLTDLPGHEASAAALALASLAHDLVGAGFEPTPLESVTETRTGADVLGRAGEDAIVAVTVQPVPPHLLTLSDGPAWAIDGTPRVIPLSPGRRISLKSRPAPSGEESARRTIVFRHAAAPQK
jgi:hypothetical protein